MTRSLFLIVVTVVVSGLPADRAWGQLFGQRTLGQAVSRQASPGAANRPSSARPIGRTTGSSAPGARNAPGAAGAADASTGSLISEDARFVRGNRSAADFVGSDAGETQQFVGRQQAGLAEEEIRSAVDELDVEMAPDANQTAGAARPARVPMYPPRLRVDFGFTPQASAELSDSLTRRLQAVPFPAGTSPIAVSVADGVATLRGTVASARERKLAELLVQFEPGIVSVQNQLTLPSAPTPPPPAP